MKRTSRGLDIRDFKILRIVTGTLNGPGSLLDFSLVIPVSVSSEWTWQNTLSKDYGPQTGHASLQCTIFRRKNKHQKAKQKIKWHFTRHITFISKPGLEGCE